MQKKLGVFLLSYKRPEYIGASVSSILNQQNVEFDFIISENSPDNSVTDILPAIISNSVKVIKRNPSLSSLNHFNTLLKECQSYEYAMLFHDDDILKPNTLSKMLTAIESNQELSSVSCNAHIIEGSNFTQKILSPNIQNNLLLNGPSLLILRYIFRSLSHTPFPSYIYRTSFLKDLSLNELDGGKYSDVSFLVKLIKRGPFLWLAEPLMDYRRHSSNDSAKTDLKDIRKLSFYFLKTSPLLFMPIFYYYFKQVLKSVLLSTGLIKLDKS